MITSTPLLVMALALLSFCNAAVYRRKRSACSNNGITDADRKLFLDYHNEARLRVAKGIEPNKVGYMNPAKNMYKLQWDCEMEQQAQDSIADCMEGYSSWDMGQNILMWESDSQITDPSAFINATLDNWWSSGKQYGVTDSENRYTSGYLYSFANMVYSEATKLGCAYKGCGNWLIMMCLYNATGFYYDKPMWETGEACKKAADCTTHANSGCDGGLCTVGGSAPEIIVPEVTTAPAVTASTGAPETSAQCSNDNGMTDSIRAVFLDMHNKFRSSLARGLEADGLGGNAPKAAKMLKMVYDCDVEASAIKYAKQCYFAHSPFSDRPGLGENLFMTDALNYDKIKAAELASKEWWVELKDYGIGQENILTDALWNRGVLIGHYTQMAWDTTYRLGCAVEHCPDMTYVVCHYGPMGNIMDQLIYTIGEPCSQCPPSYTCSKDEGLCTPA